MTDISLSGLTSDQVELENADYCIDSVDTLSRLHAAATERFHLRRESNDRWFPQLANVLLRGANQPGAEIRLQLLLLAAQWHDVQDRPEDGANTSARAVEIARELGDLSHQRRALNHLGIYQLQQRDFSGAMISFAEALRLADETADAIGKCAVLANIAAARLEAGFLADTIKLNEHVIVLCQGLPESELKQSLLLQAHHNICLAALYYEDIQFAERHMKAALAVSHEPHDLHWAAQRGVFDLTCLKVYLELDDLAAATERAALLEHLASTLKSRRTMVGATIARALCVAAEGDAERGLSMLGELEERQSAGLPIIRDILDAKGRCYRYAGARRYERYYRERHLADLATFQRRMANAQISTIKRWLKTRETGNRRSIQAELTQTMLSKLESLAVIAELREDAMGEHAFRVGRLASLIAVSIGKSGDEARALERAARLHDIGKLGLPDAILMKRTSLSDAEIELVQRHTIEGCQMLTDVLAQAEAVCDRSEVDILRMAAEIALHHHERWDGKGYPRRLTGEQIPECARITAISDAFDKLTRARPYKKAVTARQAIEILRKASGTQFDPKLLAEFAAMSETLSEHAFLSEVAQEVEASPLVAANQLIDSIVAAGETSPV